jgi:ribosome-binding factor A
MATHERRSRDSFARDTGFRGQRLEGLFREELNSLLNNEVSDPRLDSARVSRVELTRDGSRARIWFVTTNRGERLSADTIQAAFERASGFLRSRLCEALPLKRIPELRFRHDPAAVIQSPQLDETI